MGTVYGMLAIAIVMVMVGAYFWGKRSAQKNMEKKSKEVAMKTIKAVRRNEINLKNISDSDLDKLI